MLVLAVGELSLAGQIRKKLTGEESYVPLEGTAMLTAMSDTAVFEAARGIEVLEGYRVRQRSAPPDSLHVRARSGPAWP